ncbi:MAG: hypothetical protein ACYDCO_01295 [Armatimonadota bacterium]
MKHCSKVIRALMLIGLLAFFAAAVYAEGAAIAEKCKADLGGRLKVPAAEITLIVAQATVWPDAALGMPEAGKMYAQVQTPGWTVVLEVRNSRYLYTASETACRFGGPAALWTQSMLYLMPVKNEPNLNGDLYQCSLTGTNHRLLVSRVSEFYPQANGKVIVKRRTSRSGHDLLLVDAAQPRKEQKLHAALDFGEAALNGAGDEWAGFVRPRLGTAWNVTVVKLGQEAGQVLPLPDGARPLRIAWDGDRLMILVTVGEKTPCYATSPHADAPKWEAANHFDFPGARDFVLNKSQSLGVDQVKDGKPGVEVAIVWFNGNRDKVATIDGLTLRGCEMLGGDSVFIWGEQDGVPAVYTVQIHSGEVTPGFRGKCRAIKPFGYPPAGGPLPFRQDA